MLSTILISVSLLSLAGVLYVVYEVARFLAFGEGA